MGYCPEHTANNIISPLRSTHRTRKMTTLPTPDLSEELFRNFEYLVCSSAYVEENRDVANCVAPEPTGFAVLTRDTSRRIFPAIIGTSI